MSTVQRLTITRNLRVGQTEKGKQWLQSFYTVCVCVCVLTALTGDQMTRGGGQTSRLSTVVNDCVSCFVWLRGVVVSLSQHAWRANADLRFPSISLIVDVRVHIMKIHSHVWKASYRFLYTFTQLKRTVLLLKDTVLKNLKMLPRLLKFHSKTPRCFISDTMKSIIVAYFIPTGLNTLDLSCHAKKKGSERLPHLHCGVGSIVSFLFQVL